MDLLIPLLLSAATHGGGGGGGRRDRKRSRQDQHRRDHGLKESVGPANALHKLCRQIPPRPVEELHALLKTNPEYINQSKGYAKKTPLFLAIKAANVEYVRVLLAAGADPTVTNGYDNTPVMAALSTPSCLKALLENPKARATINATRKKDGTTAVELDIFCTGLEPSLALLLDVPELAVNPDPSISPDFAPLHKAIMRGNFAAMLMLLQRPDIDLNALWRGNTPLSLAASEKRISMMQYLLLRHADPDISLPSANGRTLRTLLEEAAQESGHSSGSEHDIMTLLPPPPPPATAPSA